MATELNTDSKHHTAVLVITCLFLFMSSLGTHTPHDTLRYVVAEAHHGGWWARGVRVERHNGAVPRGQLAGHPLAVLGVLRVPSRDGGVFVLQNRQEGPIVPHRKIK